MSPSRLYGPLGAYVCHLLNEQNGDCNYAVGVEEQMTVHLLVTHGMTLAQAQRAAKEQKV